MHVMHVTVTVLRLVTRTRHGKITADMIHIITFKPLESRSPYIIKQPYKMLDNISDISYHA